MRQAVHHQVLRQGRQSRLLGLIQCIHSLVGVLHSICYSLVEVDMMLFWAESNVCSMYTA